MITRQEIETTIKEYHPFLQKKFKVKRIGLFGSFVRGEATEGSDIDLLIDFKPVLGWEFFDLQEFLEQKLGRKVDLVSMRALKSRLKEKILSEVRYIDEPQAR